MINKTKEYGKFVLRTDNRAKIDSAHVKALVKSIQGKNMLQYRPIMINEKWEVIDGQHRLKAAEKLGVEIYYEMNKNLEAQDIILINNQKSWGIADYLNFYCAQGNQEYIKLKEFMTSNNLNLKVALILSLGSSLSKRQVFKNGDYVFNEEMKDSCLEKCWDTIEFIQKINGFSLYTTSAKFWQPLAHLIRHPDFNSEKWFKNLNLFIERVGPKVSSKDYAKMFSDIYNFRNDAKIDIASEF
jgi:hypothetical protein